MRSRKPTINLKCPAASYSAPAERIAEFSTANGVGGLIQIRETADGRCSVQIYRCDPGVFVSTDGQQRPVEAAAPALLAALKAMLACPDVNYDDLEDETWAALRLADAAIAQAEG